MAATIWKGHISFGLISIPVKLVRAARAERTRLHQLYRASNEETPRPADRGREPEPGVIELPAPSHSVRGEAAARSPEPAREEPSVERVRHAAVTSSQTDPIPARDLVKGYEYEPERWVVLEPEEVKRLAPATSKTIEIAEFVRFAAVDPVYLESSYYVIPERAGAKAYGLLYRALRETDFAAVGEVAMHGREHVVILRPGRTGLIAHTMFFENEVRKEEEYQADPSLASDKELQLAKNLVEELATDFQPEKYRDRYKEKLEALIAAKMQGREVAGEAAPPPQAPVVDLMEALQKSLDAARKPPARESRPAPAETKKRARRGGAS